MSSHRETLIDLILEIIFVLGMIYLLHTATADEKPPQPQPTEEHGDSGIR
jgi:hypothetical protein